MTPAQMARALNRVLPDKLKIDVAGIESLKSAGKDLGDTIIDAIANTTLRAYYDEHSNPKAKP